MDWTGQAYLLTHLERVKELPPTHRVPDSGACLRVKPIKNNQAKSVRWAKDYVLGATVEVAAAAR